MTERSVELALADEWLTIKDNVVEIGAVTPYYWPNRIKDIIDPTDSHELVNIKASLFDVSLKERDVLCLSVLEHIGTGDYGQNFSPGLSIGALEIILMQSKSALITVPAGYNKQFEDYIFKRIYKDSKVYYLVRDKGEKDNNWKQVNMLKESELEYGPLWANSLIIIMK
ncbi:MAG: hypothetical protein JRF72_12965 [Deltaproteobacteria bacterium]|jgi:hypothetical protein|nr:hypothetical protein [Deltaproteobacteria bacterium]